MPTIAQHFVTEKKSTAPVPDPSSLEELKKLAAGGGAPDDFQVDVAPEEQGQGVTIDDDGEVVIGEEEQPQIPPEDVGKDVASLDSDYTDDDKSIEEELKQINAPNAQKRIRQLTKQRHDERRAKEEQARAREAESKRANEAINYAKGLFDHNQKLAKQLEEIGKVGVTARQETAAAKLERARQAHRDALESADSDAISKATIELQQAVLDEAMAKAARPPVAEAPPAPPSLKQVQPKTDAWVERNNKWFMKDPTLTNAAMGFHQIAVQQKGLTPETDAYYTFIDENMKPLLSATGLAPEPSPGKTEPPKKKAVDTVTPVSRSQGAAPKPNSAPSNKIVLSPTQAQMARELMPDIPVKEAYQRYAKQLIAQRAQA